MLDRQKVQRIAFEQMALSRCLSRHGCILCQQVHHTDALLSLDMLYMLVLSNPRSAAQLQVWSRKTTTAAEACKIPVWGVSERSGDRKPTVSVTVGTTVSLSQLKFAPFSQQRHFCALLVFSKSIVIILLGCTVITAVGIGST